MSQSATIHASAVLVGRDAVLIRGPSGAGKSRLVVDLLRAAQTGILRYACLVGDDRVRLEVAGGRLLVRPAETLAGLLEVRGLGIMRVPYEPLAWVGGVIDLGDAAERMPDESARTVLLEGVLLPRLAVPPGVDPLGILMAWITHGNTFGHHGVTGVPAES